MIKMRGAAICALLVAVIGCEKSSGGDAAGCTKDSDCKGDRICVSGACVDAKKDTAAQAPSPTAAAPATTAASPATTAQVPPANCAVPQGARFGYVNPPPGKQHAIARMDSRSDAPEAGRLPWGTEVEVIDPKPDEKWITIFCPPVFGKRPASIHRDVLKVGEHAPAQRP